MKVLSGPDMLVPCKVWDGDGRVPFEDEALAQMRRVCTLPVLFRHAALMPDGHLGKGATVGAVIPTGRRGDRRSGASSWPPSCRSRCRRRRRRG